MSTTPSAFVIELPEGSLAIHDLSLGTPAPDAPVVLAVHGITANGLSWRRVADEVGRRHGPGGVRFLAPDLRGRGDSRSAPGPYGLGAHVDDLTSIATVFGSAPVLVGHSMGAFIAALAAARHPERFPAAVLVDGGLAFPVPDDLDVDAALQSVIGPAMDRLSMRFADPAAYLGFWSSHPAMGPVSTGPGADAARAYIEHAGAVPLAVRGVLHEVVLDVGPRRVSAGTAQHRLHRRVGRPEGEVCRGIGEAHRQPVHGRPDDRLEGGVDVEVVGHGEGEPTVDEHGGREALGVAGCGQRGDEGPHRMSDEHRGGSEDGGDRGQVVDVGAQPVRAGDRAAVTASPQVRGEEPHRPRAVPTAELVGDPSPGEAVGRDAVDGENDGSIRSRGPEAQVVDGEAALRQLDDERGRGGAHLDADLLIRRPPRPVRPDGAK